MNPHWGEQARFAPDNTLRVNMVFQGLDRAQAQAVWHPFLDEVAREPQHYAVVEPFQILALPAHRMWDAGWLRQNAPGLTVADSRPGAPPENFVWAGDVAQAGQFVHGYASRWLPVALLSPDARPRLTDALFRASRRWPISLHFNKGLAGAPPEAVAAAGDTAIHPSATNAFALAISAAEGPPAYPGLPGSAPDLAAARQRAERVRTAVGELRAVPDAGSYVSESDFFEAGWQAAFWGAHYPRLLAVKRRYDPEGLFFVHHGVGTEGWSADGFERV
jgi:hypothetical protein